MIKRIFSLMLTLCLLLAVLPVPVLAAEERIVITVCQHGRIPRENLVDGERGLAVYTNDRGDFLISGEDLEASTGFAYENDGKTATFTRGAKIVEVNLSNGKITPMKGLRFGNTEQWSVSKPMQADGTWYFSAASLFPWLNVTCFVSEGKLMIYPDEYSFWDFWGELDLRDYALSYEDLAQVLDSDSKVLKALDYTNDNACRKLLEDIRYTDEYDGSSQDYYKILECLLLDSSHSEYLADTIHETLALDIDVAGILFPDLDPIFTAFKVINDGAYYCAQYGAFTKNHTDKMELLHAMTLVSGAYTEQLDEGLLMIKSAYGSWWDNILYQYVLNLDKYLIDKIKDELVSVPIGKAILLAVDVSTKEIRDLNDRIDLMAPLCNLYGEGLSHYEYTGTHYTDIRNRRSHAILGLYAAGENLRTMATYCEKHDLMELADRYDRLAAECDRWIKRLTAAAYSQMNDSIEYWGPNGDDAGTKDMYSHALLDMFSKVDRYTPALEGMEWVEYGMLAEYMEYQPLIYASWDVVDADDDGQMEMIFWGSLEQNGSLRDFQLELDTGDLRCTLYDMDGLPQGSDPDLKEVYLSGDPQKLLQQLDAYFAQRENSYGNKATDLNGDGVQDRVYGISAAADMWLDRMEVRSVTYGNENPFGSDFGMTLVVAESQSGGLRIRFMHIFYEGLPDWSFEGGTFTIGDVQYVYAADFEEPFWMALE